MTYNCFLRWPSLAILLVLLAFSGTAYSQQATVFQKMLNGANNEIVAGGTAVLSEQLLFDAATRAKMETDYPVKNVISLRIDEASNLFLRDSFTVVVHIRVITVDAAAHADSLEKILTVNYRKDNKFQASASYIDRGKKEVTVRVLAVHSTATQNIWPVIQLENRMEIQPIFTFSCDNDIISAISYPATLPAEADQLPVSWPVLTGIDVYDLEWTYVDTSALASKKVNNIFNPALIFTNNASRVTVSGNTYKVPLLYDSKGVLFLRVRPVQLKARNGRIEGKWSSDFAGGMGAFAFDGHEPGLNWQVTTSFAEEGKRKSVIQYFDGSLRSRQTVTKDNTTDTTLIAESFYDHQGRAVIQVLPTPSLSNVIKFTRDFNMGLNGGEYDKEKYDVVLAPGTYCNTSAQPMSNMSGSSMYYSSNNPARNVGLNSYIPDAQLYPFTQTEFVSDNTGKISRQGGVGPAFQLGSGHETKYYYGGAPDKNELYALFGTDVGDASHYVKNMVRDANGQYSVSYVDMSGRTIATALAGNVPDSIKLQTLSSNVEQVVTETIGGPTANTVKGLVMESQKVLLVSKQDTYDFNYNLSPDSLQIANCDQSKICYDCLYDLQITITDDCDNQKIGRVFDTVFHNFSLAPGNAVPVGNCEVGPVGFNVSFSLNLQEGSYLVTKRLSVSKYGMDYYRDSVFVKNNTCKTIEEIAEEHLQLQRGADCLPECESCKAELGTWEIFRSAYMQKTGIATADTAAHRSRALVAWKEANEHCKQLCNTFSEADERRNSMLSDMSAPSGQYANINATGDIYSIFYVENVANPRLPIYKNPDIVYRDAEGKEELIFDEERNAWVRPQQLSPEKFAERFNNSWAESLLPYHPEYCKLVEYEKYAASLEWDKKIEAIDSYEDAFNGGYLNPTHYTEDGFDRFPVTLYVRDPLSLNPVFKSALDNRLREYQIDEMTPITLWNMATIIIMSQIDDPEYVRLVYWQPELAFDQFLCTGELDMAWRIFRDGYLQIKNNVLQDYLDGMNCAGRPTATALLAANHTLNFNSADAAVSQNGLDAYGSLENPEESVAAATSAMAQHFESNCRTYAKMWLKQLAPCTEYSPTVRAAIIEDLVKVCYKGSDMDHTSGSRTISPDSTNEFESFDAVIEYYNQQSNVSQGNVRCNADVLTFPMPYDKQPAYTQSTFGKPAQCVCEKITYWKQQYGIQKIGTETFVAYLKRVTGQTVSQTDVDALDNLCNSLACTFSSKPVTIAPIFQCYTGSVCVPCTVVDSLYAVYESVYPQVLPLIEEDIDSLQQAKNLFFEKFMNNRLGFSKSAWEYLQFMDSCGKYAAALEDCGFKPSIRTYSALSSMECRFNSTMATTDGGVIMAGSVRDWNDNENAYVVKLDKSGRVQWSRSYGGAGTDYFTKIRRDADGGYVAIGTTTSYAGGLRRLYIVKLNQDGGDVWARAIGISNTGEEGRDIITLSAGGYAYVGTYHNQGKSNSLIGVLSNAGASVWAREMGGQSTDEAGSMVQNGDTLVVATASYGPFTTGGTKYETVLYKISASTGQFYRWHVIEINGLSNWPMAIENTSQGYRIAIANINGWSFSDGAQSSVLDISTGGNLIRAKTFSGLLPGNGIFFNNSLLGTSDGGYLILHTSYPEAPASVRDYFITRVNNNNVTQETQIFNVAGDQGYGSIVKTSDSMYVIGGTSEDPSGRGLWIKMPEDITLGCISSEASLSETIATININSSGSPQFNSFTNPVVTIIGATSAVVNYTSDSTSCYRCETNEGLMPMLCGKAEPMFAAIGPEQYTSCSDSSFYAFNYATERYNIVRDSLVGKFDSAYLAKCLKAFQYESFTVTHNVNEYHYTLYYYDQAGNLIKTIAPREVHPDRSASFLQDVHSKVISGVGERLPSHGVTTDYRYNTLNQVVAQRTPDAGVSRFWYDRLGRLAVSQNALQHGSNKYSYTLYDGIGRITEVGQTTTSEPISDVVSRDNAQLKSWLQNAQSNHEQITRTVYDVPYDLIPEELSPANLRNRVSYSAVFSDYANMQANSYSSATYYSYDIHGNVDTLLQDYKSGAMANNGNRFKKLVYRYDLVSGKVNHVAYQPGKVDAFYHRYSYDAENRLTAVATSRDSVNWENDALYSYYKHGPLARLVLGKQVQGIDYAYTLQGWIKAVNPTVLLTGGPNGSGEVCSPGSAEDNLTVNVRLPDGPSTYTARTSISFEDGFDSNGENFETEINNTATACSSSGSLPVADGTGLSSAARDAFSYVLHYNQRDYKPITGASPDAVVPSQLGSEYRPLYNGNISGMGVNIAKLNEPHWYNYQYDQLNRLVQMDAWKSGTGNWTSLSRDINTNEYHEGISYDPNGNILNYDRNGTVKNGKLPAMDQLTYQYIPGTNKLDHIIDQVPAGNYTEDIDGQSAGHYDYDAIGNLIKDGGDVIHWNVYGKISEVVKANGVRIKYTYDPSGNRISKIVDNDTTCYVRDAQGNVMSVYRKGDPAVNNGRLAQTELHLYGSSRLGIRQQNLDVNPANEDVVINNPNFIRGEKFFELSNHLGNVLATVSDRKIQVSGNNSIVDYYETDVISAQDYYPFGMIQPGRSFNSSGYRYGFNGKEMDNEVVGDGNQYDYGFRIYNPRIGRFLSVDPLFQSFPWYTPYQFAGNKPIIAIDLDGLEERINISGRITKAKPALEVETAISKLEEFQAHVAAINGIIKNLEMEELKSSSEVPTVLEYGTMGNLTNREKREVIESTVKEFVICIGSGRNINPTFNPNVVEETYSATYDFNYTLFGSKEKIDAVKEAVETATTMVDYAGQAKDITGRPKFMSDNISTGASLLGNAVNGDGWGVASDVASVLVDLGLNYLSKKIPFVGPLMGIVESTPVAMTIEFSLANSAPEGFDQSKQDNKEDLKMKTIGALLYLFENNNKMHKVEPMVSQPSTQDNLKPVQVVKPLPDKKNK